MEAVEVTPLAGRNRPALKTSSGILERMPTCRGRTSRIFEGAGAQNSFAAHSKVKLTCEGVAVDRRSDRRSVLRDAGGVVRAFNHNHAGAAGELAMGGPHGTLLRNPHSGDTRLRHPRRRARD